MIVGRIAPGAPQGRDKVARMVERKVMIRNTTTKPCKAQSQSDFAAAIRTGETGHLVVFGTPWSSSTRRFEAQAARLARRHGVGMLAIDVDECPDLARSYRVVATPTLLLFRNGQLAARRIGELGDDDLEDWILNWAA